MRRRAKRRPAYVFPTARRCDGGGGVTMPCCVFQKRSSVLRISPATARSLGPIAVTLAEGEGLVAHARSAGARLNDGGR